MGIDIIVMGEMEQFSTQGMNMLDQFVRKGKSILMLGFQNGMLDFLKQYGFLGCEGLICSDKGDVGNQNPKNDLVDVVNISSLSNSTDDEKTLPKTLSIKYPYRSVVKFRGPATELLSSSLSSHAAIAGRYIDSSSNGKIIHVGSAHIFSDSYHNQENNATLCDLILKSLVAGFHFNSSTPNVPVDTIKAMNNVPNTAMAAAAVRTCFAVIVAKSGFKLEIR